MRKRERLEAGGRWQAIWREGRRMVKSPASRLLPVELEVFSG
jgi:hypothetical protein